ncbi:DUF4304 domain-containing protein [Mesorhizobium sp. M0184]|uniref:DUF4304 domain-containing protein n=1 Tax=Mesorhizobium sp. M0184 TaxID=2956906 RepID=UPI0033381884
MNKKELESLLNRELLTHGFKKKSTSWYRQDEGALQVINLQKSNFGLRFYLNLGCVPNGMTVEGMPTPKEYECPIKIRLGGAFPDKKLEIEEAFNLENSKFDDRERSAIISNITSNLIIPFLENMKDASSLIRAINSGLLDNALIMLSAKSFLGLEQSGH